jgi:hypothetical protein
MPKLVDGLVILALVYFAAKLELRNPLMVLMELRTSTTFGEYTQNYKHVLKKSHPDFNTDANVEVFEAIQTINDRFLKTERVFSRNIFKLFVVGDLNEDEMATVRSVLSILTLMLIADAISVILIFAKVTGGRRIVTTLIPLAIFIGFQAGTLFMYANYLFFSNPGLLQTFRGLISDTWMRHFFGQSTIVELVGLFCLFEVAFLYLVAIVRERRNKIQTDYTAVFASQLKKLKEANITGAQPPTEAQKGILREIVQTVDETEGKSSRYWKILQNIFTVGSILLLVSQGI